MATMVVKRRRRLPARLILLVAALLVLLAASVVVVRHEYYQNLKALSGNPKAQIITIPSGSSVKQIAAILHDQRVIRSAWSFEWYIHSKELTDKLQAGTYALAPNESVPTIAGIITKGRVSTQLVTIIPGRRIDQVRADLINDGFSPSSVDQALNPSQYADLPALAFKPANVNSLEGLLWPDSWYKDAATGPDHVIRQSLTAMGQKLTPDLQAAFASEGLSPYQGLTLASIIEQEVSRSEDRPQVAQVFLTRLHTQATQGLLGSDVTAKYAKLMEGLNPGQDFSAYDTTTHPGLPPGPISTVSESSLQALAHPASTNWLYFVTGDDGTTYFSTTLQQHEQNVQQYCHQLCHRAD